MTDHLPSAAVARPGTGLSTREQRTSRIAALLATTALVAAAALLPGAARAQDATWFANPGSGDFNTAANWNAAAVPTGTASFGTSSVTTLSFSAGATSVGGWTFNTGASAYTFVNNQTLEFAGAGIVINGGSASIINNNFLNFNNSSTAGSASIINNAGLDFFGNSTAGSASIHNNGTVAFNNTSTAGSATITNNNNDFLAFNNTSTAGSATITNSGTGVVKFFGNSTAGSATITTNAGALSFIQDSASGGTARFILNGTGLLDLSGLATGGTTVGSTEGAGQIFLGSNNLAVGGNNLSTIFSGVIQDGGGSGGTGGSLTKTGSGTLTLSGANTYTGGTTINAGTLAISADNNLGANTGGLTFNGGMLQFGASFDLANTRAITLDAGGGTFDTSGFNTTVSQAVGGAGALVKTGTGTLTLSGANTYSGGTQINAGGLVLGNNAALGTGTLMVGGAATLDTSTAATLGNNIVLNAGLTVLGSHDLTLDGSLSGTGGLTKDGTATLTLNGANTYSGGTQVNAGTLALGANASLAASGIVNVVTGAAFDLSAGNGLQTFGTLTGGGTVNLGANVLTIGDATNGTFSGSIGGSGSLEKVGTGTETLTGTNTFTGGTKINAGTLALGMGGSLAATGGVALGGIGTAFDISGSRADQTIGALAGTAGNVELGANTLTFGDATGQSFGGVISGAGGIVKQGTGTMTLTGVNTYGGGTALDAGVLSASADDNLGAASGSLIFNGGTLQITGTTYQSTTRAINLAGSGGFNIADAGNIFMLVGAISGAGALTKTGAGTLTLSGANTYSGGTTVGAGNLRAGVAGAFAGNTAYAVNGGTLDLNGFNLTMSSLSGTGGTAALGAAALVINQATETSYAGAVTGTGSLTKTGGGTLTLSGANTYTGATTVDAGTLAVNGSTASSSLLTVNAGGMLGGNGTVGNTTINAGGALAPGNSIGLLTVQGSLTFTAAASYMVQVSPSNADRTNVTGIATLGGATVNASFATGTYVAKQYTILNAAGGVSGIFGAKVDSNLPANFHTSLSYDANNAYLNLLLNFNVPTGLKRNQQNVGNALTNFFNSTGGIPAVFGALTPGTLTQASGETATGSQQTTLDAMNLFMGVLTDPFVAGRGDGVASATGAPQFADENDNASAYADNGNPRWKGDREAYGAIYRKAPVLADPFAKRWSVWAAGFGGSQATDGNAVTGSNNTTSRVFGTAVGADYHFSPDTLAGFALAGGGTNFSVANGGSGHSDLFQAGAFVRHNAGAAYISAALAYGWQDVTTDRTVTVAGADALRARFNANAYSGRVEGGYRFVTPIAGGLGITPYAAAQFTTFDLPAYAEGVLSGVNTFALAYGAKSVTDPRSELGLRTDKSFALSNAILTLRGRAAWAHDYNPDRSIGGTFQTLPGASFVVNGAAQASDSALVTTSAEMKWINGWSVAATFEGEFSDVTESYAGKGVVRYAW